MTRLLNVDADNCHWLEATDDCKYLGEYISHGTWRAGETNQQIQNLKKKPSSSSEQELHYKRRAIRYWANRLRVALNIEVCVNHVTFVPMPCSKPFGHPDYDARMVDVLRSIDPRFDIRCVIQQTTARSSQHEGPRLSPRQLSETMSLSDDEIQRMPIKRHTFVVDDVITLGASYKAAQQMLSGHAAFAQSRISGAFLAKTIWEDDDDWADAL